jgi:predicted CopG family antitoxin
MAVKTITIDMPAYNLLSRYKKDGASFSDVIKAHFKPLPTVREFRETLRTVRLSEDTLDAIDEIYRARANDPIRPPIDFDA